MLFVVLEIGGARYAIDASQIVEVLPLLRVTPVPEAPRGVAGVFNYRGGPVPVVDLSEVILGRPAVARYSTRLVLADCADDRGRWRLLALMAEGATATLQREAADFVPSGVSITGARYLGPIATDADGVIQRIDPARILPPAVHDALFDEPLDR